MRSLHRGNGAKKIRFRLIAARVLVGTLGAVLLLGTVMGSFAPRRPDDARSGAWTAPLRRMDEALAAGDIRLAERAWHDAYGQALGSRRWEGMVEAGDAALTIRAVAKAQGLAAPMARQAYLTALVRARRQGSVDGVLRAAEAFARLGDGEVVEQALQVARDLGGVHPEAEARIRGLVDQSTRVSEAAHGLGKREF
jgi:hypothetical protein